MTSTSPPPPPSPTPAPAGRPLRQPDRRKAHWRLQVVDGFHLRFVLANVFGLALLLLAVAAAAFVPTIVALGSPEPLEAAKAADRFLLLHAWLWPGLVLVLSASAAQLVYTTHKVAGPLVRFRHVFSEIRDGKYSTVVRLREGDYLGLEAQALNEALAGLRQRDQQARELSGQVVDGLRELARPGTCADTVHGVLARAEALNAVIAGTAPRAPLQPEPQGTAGHRTMRLARGGFSLVELLLAVALIVVLIAIAVPGYTGALEEARNARAIGDIKAIEKELLVHRHVFGTFPATLAEIGRDTLRDPWGTPYQYLPLEGLVTHGHASLMGNSGPNTPVGTSGPGNGGGNGGNSGGGGTDSGGGGGSAGTPRKDRNLHPLNSDFDLYSMGPDRASLPALTAKVSWDDIIRASDGGYVGRASRY